jgi:hypothetical protein
MDLGIDLLHLLQQLVLAADQVGQLGLQGPERAQFGFLLGDAPL